MYYDYNDARKIWPTVGYSEIKTGYDGVSAYIKTENDRRKMVLLINAPSVNARNAREVRGWIRYVKELYGQQAYKILAVVCGTSGRGHHFIAKNIVYLNTSSGHIYSGIVSPSLMSEIIMLRRGRNLEKADDYKRTSHYPEYRKYIPLFPWIMAAITVFLYFKTKAQWEVFGYTAKDVLNGETYRLFSYMFAHVGLSHLVGNMAALMVAGRILAKNEGNLNFLAIYLGGGVIGAYMDCLFETYASGNPNTMTIGASGAVFAIIGGLVAASFFNRDLESGRMRTLLYALFSLICSIAPGTNSWVHFFGFITGIIISYIINAIEEAHVERMRNYCDAYKQKFSA